jgi:hypothetical protein
MENPKIVSFSDFLSLDVWQLCVVALDSGRADAIHIAAAYRPNRRTLMQM